MTTSSKQHSDMAAEARRAYYKRWRAANKDKVKQYNQAYWQRKAERMEREAAGESEDK